ncbi:uncharacterized protein isoform X4 [Rhodnius prolixus]|uniref:uncharacterized protein isoform X4 n=1 Tax=Rhodnius prolixus TaxID=13249 RepID=UPI003D18F465
MSRKVYNVSIFLDLHGVSCPGVWLCPKGTILVKISLFGVSEVSKQVKPVFPLRFNERFHFQKGIIAPKAEVSTRINVRETEEFIRGAKMNPATVSSKNCKSRLGKEDKIIRQRGVCHTPFNLHCKCFLSRNINEKRCAELFGSLRPRTLTKIPKSAISVPPYEDIDSSAQTNGKIWSDLSRKASNEEYVKFQSHQKVAKKESSGEEEEEEPKKSVKDIQSKGLEGDFEKRILCPCCRKNEPNVKFRNFSTSAEPESHKNKVETTKDISPTKTTVAVTTKQASTATDENEVTSKCEVCNCPVCIKYENYFIHRALKHNRGGAKSKFTETKMMSDSSDSAEYFSPELNPTKCYCFKDKEDFNSELKLKNNHVSQEADNNTDRCIVCKCPLPYSANNVNNKEVTEESSNSLDRCTICKCPLPKNFGSLGKSHLEDALPFTQPREQFYNDLDKYNGQLINGSDKQARNPQTKKKSAKKPSSRLINQLQNKKWNFKGFVKEGTGMWDIKAAEWNRM